MRRSLAGYALIITGVLACPCHLPITLPLLLVLLGGTSIGTFLAARTPLVFLAATVYFIVALVVGFMLANHRKGAPRYD